MSILLPIENIRDNIELILCDSMTAEQAHKELFRFSDSAYVTTDETVNLFAAVSNIINTCNSLTTHSGKIHVVLNWSNLLQVSLWQASRPIIGDVFTLLKNNGVSSQELQPFKASDINDIFPWLYYGKRFDVLRKICRVAKRKLESNFKNQLTRVECHVIAEDTKKIIASSL